MTIRTERRQSRRHGFTLVEISFALLVFSLIIISLSWLTVDAVRISTIAGNASTLESQSRTRLDSFINDVHASSKVIASLAYNGVTYTTDHTSTIVLESPAYDSSNNIVLTTDSTTGAVSSITYDHIVYHLVADATQPGLYTLNRLVVAASGSSRTTTADTVIASNVSSAVFTYVDDLPEHGDGSTKVWPLDAAQTSSSPLTSTVSVNGAPLTVGSGSSNPGAVYYAPADTTNLLGTLVFTTAPASGATIDAVYPVEAIAANQDWISGVSIDLTFATKSNASLGVDSVQTSELSGRANLENHNLKTGQI